MKEYSALLAWPLLLSCGVEPREAVQSKGEALTGIVTEKKVALVLVNYAEDPKEPITKEQAQKAFFEDPKGAKAFYDEVSHGQIAISGDVLGWYSAAGVSGCDEEGLAEGAKALMVEQGINYYDYDSLVYYFPSRDDCGWGGYGLVPGTEAWLNGAIDGYLPPHELGHTLSLRHSSSMHCTGPGGEKVPYSPECTTRTYGDVFDTMGGGLHHFNVFQKSRLRIIGDCQLYRVGESGSYQIRAQNEPPSDSSVGLEIPFDQENSLYVEHRAPYGAFDDFKPGDHVTQGVLLRLAPPRSGDSESYLLDMHPETDGVEDAALLVGESFEYEGLKVTLESLADGVAKVQVALPLEAPDEDYACKNQVTTGSEPTPGGPDSSAGGGSATPSDSPGSAGAGTGTGAAPGAGAGSGSCAVGVPAGKSPLYVSALGALLAVLTVVRGSRRAGKGAGSAAR